MIRSEVFKVAVNDLVGFRLASYTGYDRNNSNCEGIITLEVHLKAMQAVAQSQIEELEKMVRSKRRILRWLKRNRPDFSNDKLYQTCAVQAPAQIGISSHEGLVTYASVLWLLRSIPEILQYIDESYSCYVNNRNELISKMKEEIEQKRQADAKQRAADRQHEISRMKLANSEEDEKYFL